MANNCKQCSIRIISHTTTPPPKAYDCVAVYIAGRRTSLVVYGWWPQPPTKKEGWRGINNLYINGVDDTKSNTFISKYYINVKELSK